MFLIRAKALYIGGRFHSLWEFLGLILEQADLDGRGTTHVHMDKAGAVNVMLYSKPDQAGKVLGAHWDIWPSSSIFSLSKALDPSASDQSCRLGQAIISETHHISTKESRDAFMSSGIRGWHTTQLPGEAVIIPPGCPHQVSIASSMHCILSHVMARYPIIQIASRLPTTSCHLHTYTS